MANRTNLHGVNLGRGADPLPGDLHQAELGEGKDIVFRAIRLHQLLHVFVELVTVLARLHVYEIHDHNSTHIPQSQLSGDLFSGDLVDLESVFLLIGGLGPDAAIDIDHVKGLSAFNHKIGSLLHRHHLAE